MNLIGSVVLSVCVCFVSLYEGTRRKVFKLERECVLNVFITGRLSYVRLKVARS